ncbi:bifunctional riboflavin kinase/FAD synthetase [Gracilibacillus alcaliphilus]|uniref:bifunctional riboflavin kinase/FAD synthetase n=1 Tax=Gracilibacillus alcaliphilus TaxID=1401441 RepID=UPI00195DDA78|nr:bifunctional riboflavin kinase/FAD synthetase [Gracilibacillus alcaliphilus]MBM7677979.1 riboflavin kinase/FMN adenylyltransferase [Gracilibacillus alcaliphilus]
MEMKPLAYPHQLTKGDLPETVAAIGFFDGVHQGHQQVIQQAKEIADQTNRASAVITFDPHPSVVLQNKQEAVRYITPIEEKIEKIKELDVDILYIIRFDPSLAQLSPAHFLEHFIHTLHITHLVAGYDFTFGHKGAGNMMNIRELAGDELEVTKVDKIEHSEEKISSTRIRKALAEGDVEMVEKLLGRSYSMSGEVIHGDKRGRTIGYPTANIRINENYYLPAIGIYVVEIKVDGQIHYAMASLGYNPTFTEDRENEKLEVHIFDFDDNIYGQNVTIYWKKYLRAEEKFSGVEALIEKLQEDEQRSREFFRELYH